MAGFRPYSTNEITVQVNDQFQLDITLEVGTITEEVDVSDNLVRVETESTQLGDVIDSKKMLALPLNGRSYLDLLGLQAGVAPDDGWDNRWRPASLRLHLKRRQCLSEWPARDGQRIPGEWRRRQRRTEPGGRPGSES